MYWLQVPQIYGVTKVLLASLGNWTCNDLFIYAPPPPPPVEKGGAYCFAPVGRYVGMYVGMSVALNLVQLMTQ